MSKFFLALLLCFSAPAWAQPAWLADLRAGGLPKRENLVISSHANPFYAVAGSPYLAEGEMAVIRPQDDSFMVVARVRVEDWQAIAP